MTTQTLRWGLLSTARINKKLIPPLWFSKRSTPSRYPNLRLSAAVMWLLLYSNSFRRAAFTGDWAGDLLFAMLLKHGLARGTYGERADDGLTLHDCAITNAVRCVPPENKPTPAEIKTCRKFLTEQIAAMTHLRAILALGKIAKSLPSCRPS